MIDIGPKYGVRAYFEGLREKTRNLAGPISSDWFERACAATRRPMTAVTMRGIVADHREIISGHGGFGFIDRWGTTLGKPSCRSTSYVPVAACITNYPIDGTLPFDEDVVLVRRLDMEITHNKLSYSMATAHLAISRHALERLYERAGYDHGTFSHVVEDELLRTLCGLAVAEAVQIGRIVPSVPIDYHHQAVPFGSGIMMLDGRIFTDWNTGGPECMPLAQLSLIKSGKMITRHPMLGRTHSMRVEHPEVPGEGVWASRVFTSRTYVDRDDMKRSKAAYYRVFDRLLDDFDFQPLLQSYFGPRHHEDNTPLKIDIPEGAMPLLDELRSMSDALLKVDRSMPICAVRHQGKVEAAGRTGWKTDTPITIQDVTIADVHVLGDDSRRYAKGTAIMHREDEPDQEVGFMVQGTNLAEVVDRLSVGSRLRVRTRWTGRSSVTILGTHARRDRPSPSSSSRHKDAAR